MGDGCFFGLVPVGDGGTYGFAGHVADRLDERPACRLDRFRTRFRGFGGPVPDYLACLSADEQIHSGPIEWVDLHRWHDGRVVLIGDAAHAAPPHMGQGGSLAVEDALVLAEELRRVDEPDAALHAYEARRRPRVDWVLAQSLATARAWAQSPALRDPALRAQGDAQLRARYEPLRLPP